MREHFAGYRSHTLVLAAFPAVALAVVTRSRACRGSSSRALIGVVFVVAFALLRGVWDRAADRDRAGPILPPRGG